MQTNNLQKLWQRRIGEANLHPGGITGYCKEKNLAKSNFYAWKNKLEKSESILLPAPFAAVKILSEPKASLPDPEWLAKFLRAFESEAK